MKNKKMGKRNWNNQWKIGASWQVVVNLLLPDGDIIPFHLLRGIGLILGSEMKIDGLRHKIVELFPKADTVRLELIANGRA